MAPIICSDAHQRFPGITDRLPSEPWAGWAKRRVQTIGSFSFKELLSTIGTAVPAKKRWHGTRGLFLPVGRIVVRCNGEEPHVITLAMRCCPA